MRNFSQLRKVAVFLALTLPAACSDASSHDATPKATATPETSRPISDAYDALVRDDFEALPGVIDALDSAVTDDPSDERSVFYAGVMRLWRMTQTKDDPDYGLAELGADSATALDHLDRARKLDPKDAHAAAFYGIAQVNTGSLAKDSARVDEGKQALEDAVSLYPAYVHGVQALAFGELPRNHPYFPDAIDALSGTVVACGQKTDTAELALPYRTGAPPAGKGACSNEGVVAHVWEGFWLTYGDIIAKQGDAAQAREAYEKTKESPAYDRWMLKDTLDARLAGLTDRVKLYQDDDTANDPLTWMEEGHLCIGCHANAP